jgi:hypothetical protein
MDMKSILFRIFAVGMVSMLLVLLLSVVPLGIKKQKEEEGALVVFEDQVRKLTNENLVDLLQPFALRSLFEHVEWDEGTLFLQLTLPSKTDYEQFSKQVYEFLRFCFVQLANVNDVRMMISTPGGEKVLWEAKRSALTKDPQMLNLGQRSYQQYLQETFSFPALPASNLDKSVVY